MKWMGLFRRRDPISSLRAEPTEEQRLALLIELARTRREDILRTAPVSLSYYTNVARGSWGYEVLSLARDGLLEERVIRGVLPDESTFRYALTPRGAQALADLEKCG